MRAFKRKLITHMGLDIQDGRLINGRLFFLEVGVAAITEILKCFSRRTVPV